MGCARHRGGWPNWVFFRASRYCPDGLAGDGGTIQQRHGGAWNLLWRLPIVFACPTHQRLLEYRCPTCHQPAQHRVNPENQMLTPTTTTINSALPTA